VNLLTNQQRQAINSQTTHFPGLDGLRVWAALMVFILHVDYFGAAVWDGWVGEFFWVYEVGYVAVDMFFVLSAFLLTLHWLKEPDYKTYIVKRFWRIAPAYYGSVLFVFAAVYITGEVTGAHWVAEFWKHLLFMSGMTSVPGFGINPVFWSLSVEMVAYLVLPFIIQAVFLYDIRYVLTGAIAIPMVWKVGIFYVVSQNGAFAPAMSYLWYAFPSFVFDFAVGVIAAKLALQQFKLPARMSNPWVAIAALMFFASLFPGAGATMIYAFPIAAILCAWLVLSATQHAGFIRQSSAPQVRWLAHISYSFYLWHAFMIYMVISLGGDNFIVVVSASLMLSLAAAWASARWIEPIGKKMQKKLHN